MDTYIGKKGLKQTWQENFPENMECNKCKGNCRIMFVAVEGEGDKKYICDLYPNMKDGKYWPHDVIACAVYLCEKCFEPNAIINQA